MAETEAIAGILKRPFPEQVAAWRIRMGNQIPTMRWTDLWQAGHDRAFVVAGAMKADLLADLAKAVDKAISEGRGLEEFRRDFRELVERNGWHGWTGEGTKAGEAWRTRVIYRTNARTSFMAGRFAQLTAAGFKYWVYRHGGSLHPREQHLAWDGLILPPDHPFWLTHFPPNGWGCSCRVQGAHSLEGAKRLGGNPDVALPANWRELDARTGAPDGIDKGWAYAPGATVAEQIARIVQAKPKLPPQIAADLAADTMPRFTYQTVQPPKTLAEMEAFIKDRGLARHSDLKGLSVQNTAAVLPAMLEVKERFGLEELIAVGPSTRFGLRGVKGANAAVWPIRQNATGLRGVLHLPTNFGSDKNYLGQQRAGLANAQHYEKSRKRRLDRGVPEEVGRRAARMDAEGDAWNFTLNATDAPSLARRKVIYHEYGHVLHLTNARHPEMATEINDFLRAKRPISNGWHLLLSNYSGSEPREYVAEAFSLYMSEPSAKHYRIHPDLLEIFRKWDKAYDG